MRKSLLFSAVLLLAACDWLSSKRFAAEVGYYAGGEIAWEIWGDFQTLEECRNAAITVYNAYFATKRAHSWACLLKNGKGGYTSRHR